MKKALAVAVLVLSATSAFGAWCHIGTTIVLCPKPPHVHDLVRNLHTATQVPLPH
jgi:hypothetical protein